MTLQDNESAEDGKSQSSIVHSITYNYIQFYLFLKPDKVLTAGSSDCMF